MAVLLLAPVKEAMGIEGTADDDELSRVMGSAEQWVADRCGPLEPATVTSVVDGDRRKLILPLGPTISVQSVKEWWYGTVVDPTLYKLDKGMVVGLTEFEESRYEINYTIGRVVCPDPLLDAAHAMVQHLWRDPNHPRPAEQVASAMAALRRAEELIKPYRRRVVLS